MTRIATLRRQARLTVFSAAYLLNVSPRTLRRWEKGSPAAPKVAEMMLDAAAKGLVPAAWSDWKQHGLDGDNRTLWRPIEHNGLKGVAAAITARRALGADAVAKIFLNNQSNAGESHANSES